MFIYLLIIILVIFIVSTIIVTYVNEVTINNILVEENIPKKIDAIIVLGAGINKNGTPSHILQHRLDKCIEFYYLFNGTKVLLTGDGIKKDYNEVKSMKEYLYNNMEINEENILLDNYGVNTFSSILRAKKEYKINSAIIITNEFHLARALYIAKKVNLYAIGLSSDKGLYDNLEFYEIREIFATIKDYFRIYLLNI